MTQNKILVTGATGHIGFATLIETLKAGHSVKAAVRSPQSADKIKSAKTAQPYLSQIEFVYVPNITEDGAYDNAVKGVDYVLHIASPIMDESFTDFDKDILQPAVKGTLGILNSAKKNGQGIKRFVITSSIVAIVPFAAMSGPVPDDTYTETSTEAIRHGSFSNIAEAYCASKVNALEESKAWFAREKPSFDVNYIAPGYVIGANELLTAPTTDDIKHGSNWVSFGPLLGYTAPYPVTGWAVHINDIAKMHVLAMDSKLAGGQLFIGLSENGHVTWGDSIEIAKKHYSEAVAKGILRTDGSTPTKYAKVNNDKTKKTLGMDFQSYEAQVRSNIDWYLSVDRSKVQQA